MKRNRITKIVSLFIVLIVFLTVEIACSSGGYSKKSIEKLLEKEYGRGFSVLNVYDRDDYTSWVEVKLDSVPQYVFRMGIYKEDKEIMEMYYMEPYMTIVADGIEKRLKEDLKEFFPEFEISVDLGIMKFINEDFEKETADYKEILRNTESKGIIGGCFVDVFMNKKKGSLKKYEEEFIYFTEEVDKLVAKEEMLPITLTIHLAEEDKAKRAKELLGLAMPGEEYITLLKEMPEMTVCFDVDAPVYSRNINEYIEARKGLEK